MWKNILLVAYSSLGLVSSSREVCIIFFLRASIFLGPSDDSYVCMSRTGKYTRIHVSYTSYYNISWWTFKRRFEFVFACMWVRECYLSLPYKVVPCVKTEFDFFTAKTMLVFCQYNREVRNEKKDVRAIISEYSDACYWTVHSEIQKSWYLTTILQYEPKSGFSSPVSWICYIGCEKFMKWSTLFCIITRNSNNRNSKVRQIFEKMRSDKIGEVFVASFFSYSRFTEIRETEIIEKRTVQ